MNFPLFIAKRIYSDNKEKRQVSKPVIRIATAGVAVGLAVMIISVCVVLGFKHTIRDKVVGFGSHIQVADYLTLQSSEQYPIQMGDSMMKVLKGIEGVKHVQRYAYKQGILKTDNDFLGVLFKGVGPEFDSTFIHQNMVEGYIPHFSDESSGNKIVISKTIADQLKIKLNQQLFCYFIDYQG
ncbi:MAG: ABC transporter permease, partial [Prevotella sp.]|nr:ABC transporter permease [Prevotella sp.]